MKRNLFLSAARGAPAPRGLTQLRRSAKINMRAVIPIIFAALFLFACTKTADRLSVRERDVSKMELSGAWKAMSARVWDVDIPEGMGHFIELVLHRGPEQSMTMAMRLDERKSAVQIVRLRAGHEGEKWLFCTPSGFTAMENVDPKSQSETSQEWTEMREHDGAVTFFRRKHGQDEDWADVRIMNEVANPESSVSR